MELVIEKQTDLAKLEGWTINKVEHAIGATPSLTLTISHVAAEVPVKLHIIADVTLGRSGNVLVCNPTIILKLEDVQINTNQG